MKNSLLISALIFASTLPGSVYAAENISENAPVTIQTIDSDTLVGQFWNPNPSPVEAIVLKRKQRAKK